MKSIEKLKEEHAKELRLLEREHAINANLPENPAGIRRIIHLSNLYGVSGSVNIGPGHFGSSWAPKELILDYVNRFPTLPIVDVAGDYRSVLIKDESIRDYKHKISRETDVAPFWLESSGIPSSWEISLHWMTAIESEVFTISISMNPSWGFRMSMKTRYDRETGVLTHVSDVSLCHPNVEGLNPRSLRFASGSCTGLNTCRVTFEAPEATLIDYVNAVCK
jgi:hypothetical protein